VTIDETYHALLMEYASGCLDEAQALIIATHLSLNAPARKIVADYESIGGAMLKTRCGSVPMKSDALKCVMDKIEKLEKPQSCTEKLKKKCGDKDLPTCLAGHMEKNNWKQEKAGLHSIHIKTTCCGYTARLVKMAPDFSMDVTVHPEKHTLAVILEGTVRGGTNTFQRGDLAILEKGNIYPLRADAQSGVICFVVKPAQSRFTRLIRKIFG
jgi:putative transcriptional regulator